MLKGSLLIVQETPGPRSCIYSPESVDRFRGQRYVKQDAQQRIIKAIPLDFLAGQELADDLEYFEGVLRTANLQASEHPLLSLITRSVLAGYVSGTQNRLSRQGSKSKPKKKGLPTG